MQRRRLHFCRVCGHLEWHAPDDAHRCPLCGANRNAYVAFDVDDAGHAAAGPGVGSLAITRIADGVARLRKSPTYPRAFEHSSYALTLPGSGPAGALLLYDAPPVVPTADAVAAVRSLGAPHALIVSHTDFVGFAELWREALGVDVWMGAGDEPLPGNRVTVAHRVHAAAAAVDVAPGARLLPVPGHSPGSLALIVDSLGAVCAGDAVTVGEPADASAGRARLTLPQDPPVDGRVHALLREAARLPTLCTCMAALTEASAAVARLASSAQPCARPWRYDVGGVELTEAECARLHWR